MEGTTKESERFNGTVRPLREGDIPALREISRYWLRDWGVIAYDEVEGDMETCRKSLINGSGKRMFVAQTPEGQVVGMMGLSEKPKDPLLPFAETDNPGELIVAYVHPEFSHGQGVGTALITVVQNLARELGKKEILLESGPRHEITGHPFYDRQPGFKRVGVIEDFYGPWLDTVVWQKSLEPTLPEFSQGKVLRETPHFRVVMDWKPGMENQPNGQRFFIEPLTDEGQQMLFSAAKLHNIGNFNQREVSSKDQTVARQCLRANFIIENLGPLFSSQVLIPKEGEDSIPSSERMEECLQVHPAEYTFKD